MASRDITKARQAFQSQDKQASIAAHSAGAAIDESGHSREADDFKQCWTFAMFDSLCLCTLVWVVLVQLEMSTDAIYTATVHINLAYACAQAVRNFVRYSATYSYYRRERDREMWELTNFPEGEVKEMRELYMAGGLTGGDADTVLAIFAKPEYEEFFVDLMMLQELHCVPPEPGASPVHNALATLGGSVLVTLLFVAMWNVTVALAIPDSSVYFSMLVTLLTTACVLYAGITWFSLGDYLHISKPKTA
jgi:hypothetical protein